MSFSQSQMSRLPFSRSQTDPTKRIAFVGAEVMPSPDPLPLQQQSHHRCSMDSSDGECCEGRPLPFCSPAYSHAIDKPTASYTASLVRRSRANTTDNTPSHSPSRVSRSYCPSCGLCKSFIQPPQSSTAYTSNPADRATSPPRSKFFLQRHNSMSILCEPCLANERARLMLSDEEEDLFVPLYAQLSLLEDEGRQPRKRRRRGSSSGTTEEDTRHVE